MSHFTSVIIRPASEPDLSAIAEIQSAAPTASQWNPQEYLAFECSVALAGDAVVGFIVARPVAEGEFEILNLAVTPEARRKGVGRRLLGDTLSRRSGDYYLEVRESNAVARNFYEHLGFEVVTKRPGYYSDPEESGLVMRYHS